VPFEKSANQISKETGDYVCIDQVTQAVHGPLTAMQKQNILLAGFVRSSEYTLLHFNFCD
jgi:hypothetical protein